MSDTNDYRSPLSMEATLALVSSAVALARPWSHQSDIREQALYDEIATMDIGSLRAMIEPLSHQISRLMRRQAHVFSIMALREHEIDVAQRCDGLRVVSEIEEPAHYGFVLDERLSLDDAVCAMPGGCCHGTTPWPLGHRFVIAANGTDRLVWHPAYELNTGVLVCEDCAEIIAGVHL